MEEEDMDCQFIFIYVKFVTSPTASFSHADINCHGNILIDIGVKIS